jgi:hypothetical protein
LLRGAQSRLPTGSAPDRTTEYKLDPAGNLKELIENGLSSRRFDYHDEFLPPLNKIRPISPSNRKINEYLRAGPAFRDGR